MAKGPIYLGNKKLVNSELLDQLKAVVEELEARMRTSIPISRGGTEVGFGVSKAQRSIAADSVISIAKAIKVLKGW